MSEENYILDSRESNPIFLERKDQEGWEYEAIRGSRFVILPEHIDDFDVFDFTNDNGDGGVEFKTFGDLINSTTGVGVYHLHEQCVKAFVTGLPTMVCVYGNRWVYQKQSGTGDALILSGLQKLVQIASNYNTTVIFVKDEHEAIEVSKTFLRKCRELPRKMPVYNLLKSKEEEPVAMLCGIKKIGPKNGTSIVEKWGSLRLFFEEISKLLKRKGHFEVSQIMAKKTPGVGPVNMERVIMAYTREYDVMDGQIVKRLTV